jgi:exodeoxyribonuclease VII large subunit
VQGAGAAEEIGRALKLADRRKDCDLLILTRGGGSLEDLWAFNEEVLARTIASIELPVICGVGHEIDFTIADFVADVRAPTPSQAAELAVPDQREWRTRLVRLAHQLAACTRRKLQIERRLVGALEHRLNRCHPGVHLRELGQRLDELEARLQRGIERTIAKRRMRVARCATAVAHANPARQLAKAGERWRFARERLQRALRRRLDTTRHRLVLAERTLASLSPLATLERGYAIVTSAESGHVVTDAGAVAAGAGVEVRLARGRLSATVDATEPPAGDTARD